MKKLVIFRDYEVNGKRVRSILRAIKPSLAWDGYNENGSVRDSEAKNLAKYLEPTSTGYYMA